jgi:membrane protein
VIAAYAPSLQMRVVRWPDTPGARLRLAVVVLRELAKARSTEARGLGIGELAQSLRTDPLQIEPILDLLVALDWAGRLDEAGSARHVLMAEPATTPAEPLLAQLLLDPSPALRAFWHRAGFDTLTLQELLD